MDSEAVSTVTTLLNVFTNLGVLGIVFWLFVVGKIHGEGELEFLKKALETERLAHDTTRHALEIETQRSQINVMTSEILAKAFNKKDDE